MTLAQRRDKHASGLNSPKGVIMQIYNVEGKCVIAEYLPTKKRFRSTFTTDKNPCEGVSIATLATAVKYANEQSAKRAIRKRRQK